MRWLLNKLAIKPLCRWQKRAFAFGAVLIAMGACIFVTLLVYPHIALDAEKSNLTSLTVDIKNGEYVYHLSGCAACHTSLGNGSKAAAGGKRIKTPFGTLLSSNITPDETFGIGDWSIAEFEGAMRKGISPDGYFYYPAFPYTTYARMSDQDIVDLKAYIDAGIAPAAENVEEKTLPFPFSIRSGLGIWNIFYADDDNIVPTSDGEASPELRRGAYLVEALGHCGECHTPRDALGGILRDKWMYGVEIGEFNPAPSLLNSPDALGDWSKEDWRRFLKAGLLPDGNHTGGEMALVVDEITSKLSDEDADAMTVYFQSLRGGDER
ncbi:c-type cytochrome [Grimontia marina]|uniref:Fructose dehydrogenase cytochrome subunit n=1 Tax=Grimontia marina TaxID=646534 RepID=A0A128EYK5_9GAMM|nr:cytochrome c [Grimontia marina]CZF79315.1 Fructose dehydrogenase cytochrome subunit precursor [Grimontia marina]